MVYRMLDPYAEKRQEYLEHGAPLELSTWDAHAKFLRDFCGRLFRENLAAGFVGDDSFYVCAILRARPEEHRWFGIRSPGADIPGTNPKTEHKFGWSMVEALFDGRWRLATPEERRERVQLDIQRAVKSRGSDVSKRAAETRANIEKLFASA